MPALTHPRRARAAGAGAVGQLRALAVANARYWPTVAPAVRAELARWDGPAERIADPILRALAIEKLSDERFNAEVAATLATLAPRRARDAATQAIVSLELLFDYLDGRTELPAANPIDDRLRLFDAFVGALELDGEHAPPDAADSTYPQALAARARERLIALPAARRVADVARASAERCAQAQTLLHAAVTLGEEQLRRWATERGSGSGLDWRAYAAGSASSVLAVHALIAAAADARTSIDDAQRIDTAYLAIGAVITMLDSLVDYGSDMARGQPSVIRLYDSREQFEQQLCLLVREALARACEAPHGEHHAMTLAGVVAYYTTHPGASDAHARGIATAVRRELSPTIWATLAVMRSWRMAKLTSPLARHRERPALAGRTPARPFDGRADVE